MYNDRPFDGRIRNDQTLLLASTKLPVLFILGLKDSKAPVQKLLEMISLPAHSESLILRDVGHMGYIESPDETLQAVRYFSRKQYSGSRRKGFWKSKQGFLRKNVFVIMT